MRAINRFLKYYKQMAGVTHRWLYSSQLRSASKLTLPDFLGINAQKSGTSWLAKNLRYHPEIFVSKEKELHYFDRNYHRSLRHYGKHFLAGRNQVKGEITPAYAILEPKVIRFIQTLMPEKFRAILEDMYAEEIGALELRFGKKVSNWRVSNKI